LGGAVTDVAFRFISWFEDQRLPDRAKAQLLRVRLRVGKSPMVACTLGFLLWEGGKPERAAAAYQLAIDSGHCEWSPCAALIALASSSRRAVA
jgi:hypothetical protein